MALNARLKSYGEPLGSGDDPQTGYGFQGNCLLRFGCSDLTADGTATNESMYIGVAASTSSEKTLLKAKQDTSTASMAAQNDNTYSLFRMNSGGTTQRQAGLKTLDADGHTDTYAQVAAAAILTNVLMLGGDVTEKAIIEIATPTTGTPPFDLDYDCGFPPDGIITLATYTGTAAPTKSTNLSRLAIGLSDMTNQWVSFGGSGTSPFSRFSRCSATNCVMAGDSDGDLTDSAKWESNNANGPTLTWTARNATARYITLFCFKGPQVIVGSTTTPTGAAPQTRNLALGFTPKALIASGSGMTSLDSTDKTISNLFFGAATATNERAAVWSGNDSGNLADHAHQRDEIYLMYTAGTPTLKEEADITTFAATSVLTFPTTHANADHFGYMGLGDAANGAAGQQLLLGVGR